MIIKSFKIFESRTAELSEDEFKNILKSECKEYINNPILLQRSKQSKSSKFGFIDPTKFYRNPLEGSTGSKHHQLLMENLPSWSKFPKRSKSIIGVTNQSYTSGYGLHRYLVIPFDGAEFGVAPDEDLWLATCVLTDGAPLIGLDYSISFDNTFSGMMRSRDISDDSYKDMILDLQRLSDEYKGYLENEYKGYEYSLFKFIKSINKSYNDIEKALDHYLNPSRFHSWKEKGFKLMDYKELSSIKSDKFEFWTESPCLLYYIGEIGFKVNSNLIKNSWGDFLNKFI
jgi:hypothetical protein